MNSLPAPSNEALKHQQHLLEHLHERFLKQGPLSFADFMNQALYAPGLGYYSAGSQKFGVDGDFVTAPEISSLFSQCLGAQCAQIFNTLEKGACILELGAGSGRMAADIITYLKATDKLPQQYFILEVSADLKQRQQRHLQIQCPDYFEKIIWLNKLPEKPFAGIILGNEVIDAMPVHLFQIGDDQEVLEGLVELIDDKWQCVFRTPITDGLSEAVLALQENLRPPMEPGFTSEINLSLNSWIGSLSSSLAKGVMLFIDYGFPRHEYYHPSRSMGTLMCHYRHHAHADPLVYIGLQDITTHVDFTALGYAAINNSLHVSGFTNQAAFLLANGLLSLAEEMNTSQQQILISQQIQQLTQPHEMGELFKVMALTKQFDEPLQGFALRDQRHRL